MARRIPENLTLVDKNMNTMRFENDLDCLFVSSSKLIELDKKNVGKLLAYLRKRYGEM